jgi:hypothetical protein
MQIPKDPTEPPSLSSKNNLLDPPSATLKPDQNPRNKLFIHTLREMQKEGKMSGYFD